MSASDPPANDSHGLIIPIGGAEEKVRDAAILSRFAEVCGGSDARVAILPTASQDPDTGPRYERLFGEIGVREARSLPFDSRSDCERDDWLGYLETADGVFLTGGNQLRLSTTLGGTPVASLLRRRNREGIPVAGTSAGAAFLPEHMIAFGDEGSTPRSDMVTLAPGLGLTNSVVVDQHFRQRDRLGRLITALAYNPRGAVGIGLDEDTAAFLDGDQILRAVGSGALTIVDPADMEFSSMDSARRHDPVCILGLKVHILIDGATFDLETRRASPPGADPR